MNNIFIVFCLILLDSCDYSKEQKLILSQIKEDDYEKYSDNYKAKVFRNFSKSDFVKLSSSKEAEVSIYFYELLVKEYPEEAFQVFLKNIDNLNIVSVATSYDVVMAMTVAEAMLFAAKRNRVFTQEQLDDITDSVLVDFVRKKHLIEDVSVLLYKQRKNPKMKYYSAVKSIIESKLLVHSDKYLFVLYFSNYNKPEDEVIIYKYLEDTFGEKSIDRYNLLSVINNSPKMMYFDILKNYYRKLVRNKKIRADESYFELESFVQAIVKYKIADSKVLLDSVKNKVNYYSDSDFWAPNEHIYRILKNEDSTNYTRCAVSKVMYV